MDEQQEFHHNAVRQLLLKIGIFSITLLIVLFVVITVFLYYRFPTTSPFTAMQDYFYVLGHSHKNNSKSVFAFLPYWRIEDTKYTHFDTLSEIVYFSLTVDGNGNFVQIIGNQTEPGWFWWQSNSVKDLIAKTQITGGKFALTVANTRKKTIEGLLSSPGAQHTFINNIVQQVISRNLNGINIDFEYDGIPDKQYKDAFSNFSINLHSQLKKIKPDITLSLDVLPSGGRTSGLFDFLKLSHVYDQFILMTYDYYGANSEVAGPVAPLYGFPEKKFLLDVNTTVLDYKKLLPSSKLLLGIPYYGWDWPVENGQIFKAKTLDQTDANGYPAVISYGRMRGDKDLVSSQCTYDIYAREPWCWYIDGDTHKDHQVWFENDQSIKEKFNFTKNQDLGGVAIWTLGYDKQYDNLWNLLTDYFTSSTK